ncbi:hypothetical protein [Nonomuraea bangladeshensis]|uniref:hypothetical protein n=1 Tax=Nonomuraea bangladeshensis TaxID=404385 RepID=UPI003C2C618C
MNDSHNYSYTVIRVRPDEEPRIGVSIYPDSSAQVTYYPAGKGSHAFIDIAFAATHVSIGTTRDTEVTAERVAFARELSDAAAAYLADCERLHAEQQAAA